MNTPTYQNNQMLQFAVVMIASIVTAVILSTAIIMTLMRGEIASALESNVTAPVQQTGATCVAPVKPAAETEATTSTETKPVVFHAALPATLNNSYNTTNNNTTTVTNNEDSFNTETNIEDSYNEDSYNEDSYNEDSYNKKDSDNETTIKDNGDVMINSLNDNKVASDNKVLAILSL